jgi:hypothetical protein
MALGFSRRGFFGLVAGLLGLAVSRRAASAPAPAVAAPPRGDFLTRRLSCVDGEWGKCVTYTYDSDGRLIGATPAEPSSRRTGDGDDPGRPRN